MGRREIQASREAGGWSVAGSFKGRRTGGRKEGREGWRDEGMKGPVGPDGWERFCLGLRARWRRVSEADRQTASGIGGGGYPDSQTPASQVPGACVYTEQSERRRPQQVTVYLGPAAPSLFTFAL